MILFIVIFLRMGNWLFSSESSGRSEGKIVTSFHGYGRAQLYKGWERSIDLMNLFKKGDLFLACSEHMKRWFVQQGAGEEKIIVHRYGVHLSRLIFPDTQS